MAEQEPGYWTKWAAGIVAAVIGGVLVAVIVGAFDGGSEGAQVRITEFDTAPNKHGELPEATFTVHNAGDDAADRCQIVWNPFGANLATQASLPRLHFSEEFAVEPKKSHELTLVGRDPYQRNFEPVTFVTSSAQVNCANAQSKVVKDTIPL